MRQAPLISFIVPVYNMENYLRQCLDSILIQNVNPIEIILINDGSTDGSLYICKDYEMRYPFIKVVDKTNGGISSARNVGLKSAKGEYICFVDSDDYYYVDFARTFYDICKDNELDIIRGGYSVFDEETKGLTKSSKTDVKYANKVLTGKEFLKQSVDEKANEVVPWLGFFRTEFLREHGLLFPEGISYEEDQLFFLEALLCDNQCKVLQSDIDFYAYRKRVGSATKTPSLKQVRDILYVVDEETQLIEKYEVDEKYRKPVLRYICSSFYQLTSIYGRLNKEDADLAVGLVPGWMTRQCINNAYDWHQGIKIFLFAYARFVVDWIYKTRGLR